MLYVKTAREWWSGARTAFRFYRDGGRARAGDDAGQPARVRLRPGRPGVRRRRPGGAPAGDRDGREARRGRRRSCVHLGDKQLGSLKRTAPAAERRSQGRGGRAPGAADRRRGARRRWRVAHLADAGDGTTGALVLAALGGAGAGGRRAARTRAVLPRGQPAAHARRRVSADAEAARQARGADARADRSADAGAGAPAGRLRPRPGADPAHARRDHDRGVRLLLDGLRPGDSPAQRRGDQPVARARLPGQPRHGLPEGLGGADAAGRARSRHAAAGAQRGRQAGAGVVGRRRSARWCRASRRSAQTHGPQSVAFLGTGQIPTEELAFLGALAKFGMGMVHGDGNTRQCMATAVVAYKQSFGFDAPPYTYADFEESDVLVFVGSNLCIAHPIMWERVCQQPAQARDRRHRSAQDRDRHGGDAAPRAAAEVATCGCFYGAREPADRARLDRPRLHRAPHQRLRGVRGGGRAVHAGGDRRGDRPARGGRSSGSRDDDPRRERVSFWWTMGVNQSHEGVRARAGDHQRSR